MFEFGITVTEEVNVFPAQPKGLVGVTVKVVVTVLEEEFVSVPVIGFAEPVVLIPVIVPVWLRVHPNVVPTILLLVERSICEIGVPEQILWEEGVATPTGFGFTVSVTTTEDTVPQVPVTIHLYCRPLTATETFVRLYVAFVAPPIFAKPPVLLSCH